VPPKKKKKKKERDLMEGIGPVLPSTFCHVSEIKILNQRPKLLRFHMPPTTKHQIKRQGEGRERRFITQLRTCYEESRVNTQLVFSHLQATDMSYRFK
jgi:hypothetical protein